MYTLALRPHCPRGKVNQCINFEQESTRWSLARFPCDTETHPEAARGLVIFSPLQSIDISVEELAILLGTFETAYEDLCDALYLAAPTDLRHGVYGDLKTFMACVPESPYTERPAPPTNRAAGNNLMLPFLHDDATDVDYVWNGRRWARAQGVSTPTTKVAGSCFGYTVRYDPDNMNTEHVREPAHLAAMLYALLEDFSYLDSPAKVYTNSIYCVF